MWGQTAFPGQRFAVAEIFAPNRYCNSNLAHGAGRLKAHSILGIKLQTVPSPTKVRDSTLSCLFPSGGSTVSSSPL